MPPGQAAKVKILMILTPPSPFRTQAGAAFDLAISGNGYFVVRDAQTDASYADAGGTF